jgi:transposase
MCYKHSMEKKDTRTLKPDVQEQIRYQAVRLRKAGEKYKEIGELLGVSYSSVCEWYKAYEREGIKGIKAKKRGRKVGSCRTLNADQEKQIRKMIQDKCPDQLKLPFALWTRIAVQQLIKRLLEIDMPIRTVGEYLKRWGFTPQKPFRRAYEQNPKAVKKWLDEQYPAIAQRAKKEEAEIQWGDETGLCNDSQHGRSYAPRGKTPAIRLPAKRERINLISSITNQGKVRFMIYKDTMNAKTFRKFVKRLIKAATQKIFLILDNLRVHHSYVVKEWLENHKNEIELFFLPSYSPELNPDEYLNCDLKAGFHSGVPARTKSQMEKKAISHLRMLQKKPKRVQKYFEHHKIAYAA